MGTAEVLLVLSCRLAFFRRNFRHYRGISVQSAKSDVFYRALWHRLRGGPGSATPVEDSRILGALARTRCDPANYLSIQSQKTVWATGAIGFSLYGLPWRMGAPLHVFTGISNCRDTPCVARALRSIVNYRFAVHLVTGKPIYRQLHIDLP